jgi:outer membrane receptor protein involved in Fe transport
MTTHVRVVAAAAVVVFLGGVCAQGQPVMPVNSGLGGSTRPSRLPVSGTIASVVHDINGVPVAGAIVSAVGGRTATGTTDTTGRCTLAALPAGEYLVRVHRAGFTIAHSLTVRVVGGHVVSHSVVLTPIAGDKTVAARGEQPEIMAAGFLPAGTSGVSDPAEPEDHDHSETAWRLRHVRRSVLRDAVDRVADGGTSDYDPLDDGLATLFGRAMSAPARLTAALFNENPFTGQVNLLTTSTFDRPEQLLSDLGVARGVAYLSLGAAAGQRGDWNVQAAMTQGDVTSWMFAGSYVARSPVAHRYELGMTYAAQRYTGTNPAVLTAVAEGSRNAGAVFAFDTWTVSRAVSLVYGARYSSYGYVENGLFSPRVQLNVTPTRGLRLMFSASRRAEAPGADEFAPTSLSNAWLPPERTFAPLVGDRFTPERTDTYQVALERDLSQSTVLAVRTFYQRTDNQVATVFGLTPIGGASPDLDHYVVADAGDFAARGWTVSVRQVVAGRLRGSVDYTVTTAQWEPSAEADILEWIAPSAVRRTSERLQDLTTSVETDIPLTATRVFAAYRINNAFAGALVEDPDPGIATRFDVQVTQSLPFLNFSNAQWEALVGVRNLFREMTPESSSYDELLVVKPPKRVVGGVTVRF